jgi:hypothetical protein
MMQFVMQGVTLAPAAGAWLRGAVAMALASRRRTAYDAIVPDKEGNRLGRLNRKKRTDRAMRFFYVHMPSYVSYERRWRGSLRACWFFFFHQSTNPAIRRSPRLVAGRGLTVKKEATMPSCTPTPVQNSTRQTTSNLLAELQKAEQIIIVMLNAMTPAQKLKVHAQLDDAGVSGDGMTRYHERRSAMETAQAMLAAHGSVVCGGAA